MTPELSALPTITPAAAALLNRLAASSWRLLPPEAPDGAVPVLDVRFLPVSRADGVHVELEISTDFGTVLLEVEAALVDLLSDDLLPGWREEAADSLPIEWRAVLALETFATGMSLRDGLAVKARISTEDPGGEGPPLARLCGSVLAAGRSFGLLLDLSGIDESRLAAVLPRLQPHGRLNDFDPGFCCRLYLPGRTVTPAAYWTLESGDVLLAAELEEGRLPVSLEVPETVRFGAGLNLETGVVEIFESAGLPMDDTEDDYPVFEAGTVYDKPPLDDPIEDLPVRLDFLLSTSRIGLSQFRALGPGAVLDLNIDLARPVTILANGAPAAKGYLVQIGDRIGVQISHWPGIGQNGDA